MANITKYVKDGINDYGKMHAVNPNQIGIKVSAHYQEIIPAGKTVTINLRLLKQRKSL